MKKNLEALSAAVSRAIVSVVVRLRANVEMPAFMPAYDAYDGYAVNVTRKGIRAAVIDVYSENDNAMTGVKVAIDEKNRLSVTTNKFLNVGLSVLELNGLLARLAKTLPDSVRVSYEF